MNMCELCNIIQYKSKKGRIMVKKYIFLYENVIDIFHDKIYILTIKKLPFHLAHVSILGSMKCGKTRDIFHDNALKNNIKLKEEYAEKFSKKWYINKKSTLVQK